VIGGVDAEADPRLLHHGRKVAVDEHMVDATLARKGIDLFLAIAGGADA
jgi:hypothetical protein